MLEGEIVLHKSRVVNDTGSNGGPMDDNVVVISGAVSNLFPKITRSDRTNGRTLYRKVFWAAKDTGNSGGELCQPAIFQPTPGEDFIVYTPGTQDDIQSDITGGTPRWYGSAALKTGVTAGSTSIVVTVEDWANAPIFENGDSIVITTDTAFGEEDGATEEFTISGAPVPSGNDVTLTLSGPLANDYSSLDTKIWSTYDAGTLKAGTTGASVVSGAGVFDDSACTFYNIGTIYDTITLTFTSATAYDAVSSEDGALGSGTVGGTFAPINPDTATPYITVPPEAFSGTYAGGDTVTIPTVPSGQPFWLWHEVPAGATVTGGNAAVFGAFVDAL